MNRILIFALAISIFSCSEDSEEPISNNLKKRVLLLESFASSGTYVSDSIIEYYENKMIVRRDYFYRRKNDPFTPFYRTYSYNQNNLLATIDGYNDASLSDHYLAIDYSYNNENIIKDIHYEKFKASNFSSNLANNTTHFEYIFDTVKTYSIDHLNNDTRKDLKEQIVYGNLDSINLDNKWMYVFDDQNDLYEINCLGNDCDTYFNKLYEYVNIREPLINNIFGSDLNSFLIGAPITYYHLEIAKKYTDRIFSIYPSPDRNGEMRKFNYIFDQNDRLIEFNTSGTFAASDIVRYFYE